MNNFIENLQIIVLFTSVVLIVLLTSFTIIYKIRQYFPTKVNCWFCNQNFKVSYEKSNSWTCPQCEQYNGFDEDGDYNEEIPGQRYNKSVVSETSSYCEKSVHETTNSNGLCGHCNRNQALKINLIASFVPKDEDNYDEEIDEYKQQLEHSYQLCQKCQKVLKRRLNRVKTNILGSKLNRIASQGLKIIDQQIKKINNSKPSKLKMYFSYVCYYTVIFISIINFCQIFQTLDFSRKRLEEVLPSNVTYGLLIIVSYISAIKQTLLSTIHYFFNFDLLTPSLQYVKSVLEKFTFESFVELENETKIINNNSILMQVVGLTMSIGLLSVQMNKKLKQFVIIMLWNIGQLLTEVKSEFELLNKHFSFDLIMVGFCSTVFIMLRNNLHTSNVMVKDKKLQNLNDSFHRIYSDNISDVSDDSDSEEDISSNYLYSSSPKLYPSFNRQKANSLLSLNSYKFDSPLETYIPNDSLNSGARSSYETVIPKQVNSIKSINGNNSTLLFNTNNSNSFHNNSSIYSKFPSSVDSLYHSARSNNTIKQNPFNTSNNVTQLFNTSSQISNPHPVNVNSLNLNSIQLGSNRNGHSDNLKNPFLSNYTEERSPSSCSVRSSIIVAPSRFNSPSFGSSASQSSWVAGGFWSTSPQKKVVPLAAPQSPLSINFCPIVSRTSSQSSGFESQLGAEQNSRESSIGDELEKTSVFSEPVDMFHKPSQGSTRSFYQYGNRRVDNSNLAYNNNKIFSLKNLTNDLPAIPKGRLLKNWINNNNPMTLKVHQKTD